MAAWLIAFFMMVTRKIAKVTDPIRLQAANGVMAVLMLAPALWFFRGGEFAEMQPLSTLATAAVWDNWDYCAFGYDLVFALCPLKHHCAPTISRNSDRHCDWVAGFFRPAQSNGGVGDRCDHCGRALYPHKGAGHFGALCNTDPTVWANFRGRISNIEQFSGARTTFPLQRLDVPIWPFGENSNPSVGQ